MKCIQFCCHIDHELEGTGMQRHLSRLCDEVFVTCFSQMFSMGTVSSPAGVLTVFCKSRVALLTASLNIPKSWGKVLAKGNTYTASLLYLPPPKKIEVRNVRRTSLSCAVTFCSSWYLYCLNFKGLCRILWIVVCGMFNCSPRQIDLRELRPKLHKMYPS
jgi:hypothetical protein